MASLLAQTAAPYEIIVVVDHNEDLLAWATARWPEVVVVPNDLERGLSGSRNVGLRRSRGEITAFLDDDARARPGWAEGILATWGRGDDEAIEGVGGRVSAEWLSPRPSWFPEEFDWVVGCSYLGLPERRGPVRNLIGASMAFRRGVLEEVGGFRSELGRVGSRPLGCEETELCIRIGLRRPGSRIIFDPGIQVDHVVPAQRATLRYFVSRCYSEGISKAMVAGIVGTGAALETERRYATRVLPAGVARGLRAGVVGLSPSGFARAGAIILGLAATATGYLRGRVRRRWPFRP